MDEGTIKTITDRGFGFIRPDNAREDVFFHQNALVGVSIDQLRQGDRVSFTIEPDPRSGRMRAQDVRRVE
jgi:CspA family cold shock protein